LQCHGLQDVMNLTVVLRWYRKQTFS